ncbi:hypothetical protein GO730_31740 [Spirosoma sp. HMF3257]|uniref:hypothetical protein n=1 Tax=Spirosoma telluris TaxID=2183553 RepID=UPI0011B94C10|nr:hypothetical protein [Spirosoma telluris]
MRVPITVTSPFSKPPSTLAGGSSVQFRYRLSVLIGCCGPKPLVEVVIGGLITATILTLLVFPIIYCMFYRQHVAHNKGLAVA